MAKPQVDIILQATDKASKTIEGVTKKGKDLGGLVDAFTDLTGVSLGAVSAIGFVSAGLKRAIDEASDAERVNRKLEAVLQSTGHAAGLTAERITEMSDALSLQTAVDDEVIREASAMMLTFTRIGGEVFPRAMQATLDMSAALGTNLNSTVMQLGRALDNPQQGLAALTRLGITFTAEQRNMIGALVESGQTMKAQEMILDALSTKFGGQAVAAAQTYEGQLKLLDIQVGNLAAGIGEKLIPVLTKAAAAINLMMSADSRITTALSDHNDAVAKASMTYEDYVSEMTRAANAAGLVITSVGGVSRVMEVGAGGTLQYSDKMSILSSEEWMVVQATEAVANAARNAAEPVEKIADVSGILAARMTDSHIAMDSVSNAAAMMVTASQQLAGATSALATAQDNWRKGAGGQMASDLQAAGVSGDKYRAALELIDEVQGTSLLPAQQLRDAQTELAKQYAQGKITGDAFKQALIDINDQFMPLDESIRDSTELMEALLAKMREFERSWTANVRVVASGISPVGGIDPTTLMPRAAGGAVVAGMPYMVGEHGAEMFVPNQSGNIVNNYNLSVMTGNSPAVVQNSFAIMQALAGV